MGHTLEIIAQQPVAVISVLVIYKIVALLVGLGYTYFGYRLFLAGIFTPGGDIDAKWKDMSLLTKQAAPGTLFALFGTVIICVTLFITDFGFAATRP